MILLCAGCCPLCRSQSSKELLDEGSRLLWSRDFPAARQQFERALVKAREEKDQRAEGAARLGLGKVLLNQARYPAAREELEQAASILEASSDRLNTGRVYNDLGFVAWAMGDRSKAGELYRKAAEQFEAAGAVRERASTVYNLSFTLYSGEERKKVLQQGLDLARQLGDGRLEGMVLHAWADSDFADTDLAAAAGKLDLAAKLLNEAGARRELARVFTSLGRLYRFHGHPDRALEFYGRALKVQEELGDKQGIIQSVDTLAIAYQVMGEHQQALKLYRRALSLARETGSPGILARQLTHLAAAHNESGEYTLALESLDEASRLDRPLASPEYQAFSRAYAGLGRYREALAAAENAVERAGTSVSAPSVLADALCSRAQAKEKLGRRIEALTDARAALGALEKLRSNLVPTDFMKSGFSDQYQELFTFLIGLLYRSNQHQQALEAAEQGRARAFLDLLATRELEPRGTDRSELAALREMERSLQGSGADPLLWRGGRPGMESVWQKWQGVDSELKSLISLPAVSTSQLKATASRLRSTIISYWVSPDATFVWIAQPGKDVRGARVDTTASHLRRLISQTSYPGGGGGRELTGRGGDSICIDPNVKKAWRDLYDVLILPVRHWLPAVAGSRLTVVPHGPLFRVSFAALLDENGQYLLERYDLHYVPAAAVFEFTGKRKQQAAGRPARYLLVADPSGMPLSPEGRPLPRLPGSRREVSEVARHAPPGTVTLLTGDQVLEDTIRSRARDKTVIHFATHGIVRDDQPLDSFLALGQEGRLTAQEIYGLDLTADLVVLSACRTGLGKISGDGIAGLTRAFFYAGTPSVLATLWDVADDPTCRLVSEFYRSLQKSPDKARALRMAQLNLLTALRRICRTSRRTCSSRP
jgi:tetratricopeptide (TPR) repeat protein